MPYRRSSFVASVLLLVLAGVAGVWGALVEGRGALSLGQRIATFTQLSYGVLAVLTAVTLVRGSSWSRPLTLAWAVAFVVTGGLAPIVWGGTGPVSGIAGALVASLVAFIVIWLARRAVSP
jgi:hypothetical protein